MTLTTQPQAQTLLMSENLYDPGAPPTSSDYSSVTSPSSFSTYPLVRAFQCFNFGLFILFTTYSLKGMFLRLQLYTNLSSPDFSSLSIMFQTTYAKCSKYVAMCSLPVYFFKGTRFTCFAIFFFTQHGSLLHFICFY